MTPLSHAAVTRPYRLCGPGPRNSPETGLCGQPPGRWAERPARAWPRPVILAAVATRPTRDRILRTIRSHPHLTVAGIAAAARCHPSTVKRHLATLGPVAARRLAQRWGAELASFWADPPLKGQRLTPAQRLVLWSEERANHRSRCAVKPHLPTAGLRRLASDPVGSVAAAAASHPRLAAPAANWLLHHPDREPRVAAAANPNTRIRDLRAASRHPRWHIRQAVAGSSRAPGDVLARLAGDDDCQRAVARNRSCPVAVLDDLGRNPSMLVRFDVAANPATGGDAVRRLAGDSHPSVRAQIAARGNCPADLLGELAGDSHDNVRTSVAFNTATPAPLLRTLAADPDRIVARTAFRNPYCPRSAIEAAAAGNDEVRAAAATEALQERQAADPNQQTHLA